MKNSKIEKLKKVKKAKLTNNSFNNTGFSEKDSKRIQKEILERKI